MIRYIKVYKGIQRYIMYINVYKVFYCLEVAIWGKLAFQVFKGIKKYLVCTFQVLIHSHATGFVSQGIAFLYQETLQKIKKNKKK